MGATVGHSLLLPFRWQFLVVGLMVGLGVAFHYLIGPVGLLTAGGLSLILSAWLERRQRPTLTSPSPCSTPTTCTIAGTLYGHWRVWPGRRIPCWSTWAIRYMRIQYSAGIDEPIVDAI